MKKEIINYLDEILVNLEEMNELLIDMASELHMTNNYKPKHIKKDEDAVMDIFNDLINDLDNVNVTIIKKDN